MKIIDEEPILEFILFFSILPTYMCRFNFFEEIESMLLPAGFWILGRRSHFLYFMFLVVTEVVE